MAYYRGGGGDLADYAVARDRSMNDAFQYAIQLVMERRRQAAEMALGVKARDQQQANLDRDFQHRQKAFALDERQADASIAESRARVQKLNASQLSEQEARREIAIKFGMKPGWRTEAWIMNGTLPEPIWVGGQRAKAGAAGKAAGNPPTKGAPPKEPANLLLLDRQLGYWDEQLRLGKITEEQHGEVVGQLMGRKPPEKKEDLFAEFQKSGGAGGVETGPKERPVKKPKEGDIQRNTKTGERRVYRGGKWVPLN